MSAINHHYNPQVYLRQFKCPKTKKELWEYDLTSGMARKSMPEACGFEEYYNSVAQKDGSRDDETIEKAFHPLENALPELFGAIRIRKEMTGDLWSLFFTFAAVQDARSPATIGTIDDFLNQIHQTSFEILCKRSPKFQKASASFGVDPLKLPDMVEMKASQGSALLLSLQGTIQPAFESFSKMNWSFVNAPPGKFFFTSDHPICRWVPPESRTIYSGGHYDQDIEITFPLSRRVCACGHWTKSWPNPFNDIPLEVVDTINRRTVNHARNFVYGPTKDEKIEELVQKRFKQM